MVMGEYFKGEGRPKMKILSYLFTFMLLLLFSYVQNKRGHLEKYLYSSLPYNISYVFFIFIYI